VVLSALALPDAERAVGEAMMRETTTLGVRVSRLERWELEREMITVQVRGEPIRLKVGRLDGDVVNVAPEYDDCTDAAHRLGVPAKVIWQAAMAAASDVDGCRGG
jgi:pyridinium-3,5-bisthiocarboxylic acid mononucleotide nickel chelatase